jgi:hypothetical protein
MECTSPELDLNSHITEILLKVALNTITPPCDKMCGTLKEY